MTQDEAVQFLQSIAVQAVVLQTLVSEMDQGEMSMIRRMDEDITDLLDYIVDGAE